MVSRIEIPDALEKLAVLELSGNPIEALTLPQNLQDLTEINLSGTRFTNLHVLESCPKLEFIRLERLRIEEFGELVVPGNLPNLRELNFSAGSIPAIRFEKPLPQLGRTCDCRQPPGIVRTPHRPGPLKTT